MNETSADWLRETILAGEPNAWQKLCQQLPAGVSVPAELIAAAACTEQEPDPARLREWSQQLRRLCSQTATAKASVVLAAVSVLRLSALGHDDDAWSALMPRWLVASLSNEERGLGLLALALNSRERLNADDYAAIMDEAVRLLPPPSPLRSAHLYQYALYLGLRGMLQRIADLVDLPRPGDQEPDIEPTLLAECFYDAVCCGRTGQAAFLERRLLGTPESAWQLGLFQMHRIHVPVMDAVLHRKPIPVSREVPSSTIIQALIEGDRDVLDAYVADEGQGDISPLLGFDALRVALANHDQATARRILDARANSVGKHWLDDFFLARLLLLEDRAGEAGAAFARVELAALRYGGVERLEIELRLALDLSRHDCCRLGLLGAGSQQPHRQQSETGMRAHAPALEDALLAGSSTHAATLRQHVADLAGPDNTATLIVGPDDGSRRAMAAIIHRRSGQPGPLRHCCASVDGTDAQRSCLAAIDEPGLLLLDDIDRLDDAGQAALAARLQQPMACRLLLGAPPGLPAMVAAGRWRQDLYWSVADRRATIPSLSARPSDIPEILLALLALAGVRVRWEVPARQTLAKSVLSGGWVQLLALARVLGRRCRVGTIDAETLDEALAELTEGMPTAAG